MLGRVADEITQSWVRLTGRMVDLSAQTWLDGPIGGHEVVAAEWLPDIEERLGGVQRRSGGLLPTMSALAGSTFDPAALRPEVADFYERTSEFRLDVWSQWSPWMWPGGWLISAVFAKRLQQLALPLRPLEVAYGIDSEVVTVEDASGHQLGAAWLRKVRATGQSIYSGWYSSACLPGSSDPVVRVVFPLPNGSCTVFLSPSNGTDGALVLSSPLGPFGAPGAYLLVRAAEHQARVRRIPIAETFRVFVDDDGSLRTDHHMQLGRATVVRLHYRMTAISPSPTAVDR